MDNSSFSVSRLMFNDSAGTDIPPVCDLCNAREKRFLLDLIAQEEPGALDDHPHQKHSRENS